MAELEDDIAKISNVLNDTKAYRLIARVLGVSINPDSQIFVDIEEYIAYKYREMEEENLENEDE